MEINHFIEICRIQAKLKFERESKTKIDESMIGGIKFKNHEMIQEIRFNGSDYFVKLHGEIHERKVLIDPREKILKEIRINEESFYHAYISIAKETIIKSTAIDTIDSKEVTVKEALKKRVETKEKGKYECSFCRAELLFCAGQVNEPHFKTKQGVSCCKNLFHASLHRMIKVGEEETPSRENQERTVSVKVEKENIKLCDREGKFTFEANKIFDEKDNIIGRAYSREAIIKNLEEITGYLTVLKQPIYLIKRRRQGEGITETLRIENQVQMIEECKGIIEVLEKQQDIIKNKKDNNIEYAFRFYKSYCDTLDKIQRIPSLARLLEIDDFEKFEKFREFRRATEERNKKEKGGNNGKN